MIKILGFIDIAASIILILSLFGLKWNILFIILMIYLFLKGIIFVLSSFDFASIIDVLSSVIILLTLFMDVPSFLIIISAALLFQKGVFSLF